MKAWFKNRKLPILPIYPILFGVYPVLYLWNANRVQQPAYVVIPSLLITLAGILAVYLVAYAILRSIHRAALLATILSFYLLTYGHLSTYLTHAKKDNLQTYTLVITAVLVVAIIAYLAFLRAGSPVLTKTLNLISAALVLFNFASATPYYLSMARLQSVSAKSHASSTIPVTGDGPTRDVYFILIDNYGRQDILKEAKNFDNTPLVNALKERGFIFPNCVQGNYMSTAPVISSILNMNYLDALGVPEKAYTVRGGYDKMALLIQDSKVIEKFHAYGYHVVTFRGFMGLIDIKNSDTYISYDKDAAYTQRLETTKFQELYYSTTLFSPLNERAKISDWFNKNGPDFLKKKEPAPSPLEPEFEQVYQQNLYAWDALTRIPKEIQSPKFVYAHIYTSHWPFMMRPDGSLRLPFTKELTRDGYIDAVQYTNSQVLKAIDSILKNSKVPPVIILQGDHSDEFVQGVEWSGTDRLKILSAFYLPDNGQKMLRDTISPVNNFRLVFSQYFGENLPLLPDINYYIDPQTRHVATAPSTCISNVIK